MNTRTKAQLRQVVAMLEEMYADELKAEKKHKAAGLAAYQKHAAWCAEGIHEALMLLKNKFPAEAIGILETIVASTPDGDLQPHKRPKTDKPKRTKKSSACSRGECNHLEHL